MNTGNTSYYLQSGMDDADGSGFTPQPLAADVDLVIATANGSTGPEVVFVEGDVPDLALLQQTMGAGREFHVLDPSQDGLAQMTTILAGRSGISALHLVTHGTAGAIELGATTLDAETLAQHQAQLQAVGNSLAPGGDILLYGCDVGAGQQGQAFVDRLAAATGADVAASNDLTGAASLGGDWNLEVHSGDVQAAPAVSAQLAAHYMDVLSLSSVTVNFGTSSDFISYGSYASGAASDVTYKVSNNPSYVLKINGADLAAYAYAGTSGYVTLSSTASPVGESLVTVSFAGGNLFTLSSLDFTNFDGTNSQTEVFRGYDASNTLVATTSASTAATGTSTVSFTGFTNIATLKITATTNGGYFYPTGVSLDNLVFSTITSPPPTVTDARISISGASGTGGAYKIGDTVTATWNNTAGGDNNAGVTGVTVDFSQFGGGSAVSASNSSGTWTATYTILAGSIDGTNKNVSVTATTGASTTAADTTNATVDNIAPTVTDAHIGISGASGTGGAFKIGDTVTATWNNTAGGDNNSDTISAATMDFSQFGGGSAVAATNSSGTWTATYTIVSGAIDGTSKNVSVTATDNAGNTKTVADTSNATLDNIAPTVTDAHISISGASGTGGAFKIGDTVTATWNNTAGGDNNSDTISAATVDFSQFGGGSAVAATNSSGTWTATYTIVSGALDGVANRNVSVTATDNAGNTATAADTSNATVDNVAPSITLSGLAFSSDTGTSSTDFVTNTAAQTITATLSGALAGGDILYGSLDNGSTWTDITSKVSGTTLSWNGVTLAASDTLELKVTDASGNDGAVKSQAYVLDTTAPAAPSTPDLASGSDSGSSNSDNITSATTPTITGTAESGATVTLYDTDGTTVLGTGTATGGNWSITSSALSEGAHTLTAKATDAAGNTGVASSGLSVTVDTTAPAAPSTPDLASGSDSGSSNSDNITNVTTPTITGTAESGATVTLYDTDGTTVLGTGVATGGNWSITSSALSEGAHTLTAKATDTAGNIGVASSGLSVTVDTTAPTTTISTMAFSADTGSSSTDFITKTAAQTISGTTSANIATGEIVQVSTDNGSTWTTATTSVGANTWSLSGVTLAGSDTLKVRVADTAGNTGTTASQAYVLDTAAPAAPSTPDMASGSDSGSSNSDNITSVTTPTITGTAESGATVTLYDGATQVGTATATGGNWSITSSALGEGGHTLTATATDAAGNVSSASSGLSATIDTTAPSVSSVAVPTNGTYPIGQTLQFTVNFDENLTVDTSGGTPRVALTIGASTDYATYVSGSGTSVLVFSYTVQAGDTDADGISVGALQANGGILRDPAGNDATLTLNSVASTAGVLVDGVAPTVSSVAVPADGSYGAGQNLDFTVNFSEATTVTGTPHIALTLDTGGTVYADYLSGSGTSALVFRYTVTSGVDDPNGVTVGALGTNGGTLRDAAGNDATLTLNSVASTAAVLVDTTAPTVTFSGLSFSSDSGASGTDFITNVAAQTIGATLSGSPGADHVYGSLDGGSTWTDVTAMVSGTTLTWTGVTLTASGTLELKVRDAAGNDGPVASQSYVLDTTAPLAPSLPDMSAGSDSGSSSSDDITSNTTPTFTGTAEAGSTVTLYDTDGSTVLGTATATGGNWSITSSGLSDGAHTLTAKAVDAAGNVSAASTSLVATIDTAAPAAPSTPDLAASSDDGASSTDNATSITTPTFTGSAESGSMVTLYDTDGTTVLGTATATGGNWSITSSTLALGGHTIFASATDAAGNAGVLSSGLDVTIQVPGTTPPSGHGNDVLVGTAGDDVLNGGVGRDVMIGGPGNDTYYVDTHGDVVTELPGEGTDTVFASRSYTLGPNVENLTLTGTTAGMSREATGNELDNVLVGNEFGNILAGLAGADTLTGGLGGDRFVYFSVADSPATPGSWDVITDFNSAQGDSIDLRRVDANAVKLNDQHFTFIGSAAFSGVDATGQLRFDSATHMLYGSTNADSTAEFAIELVGVNALTLADLRL